MTTTKPTLFVLLAVALSSVVGCATQAEDGDQNANVAVDTDGVGAQALPTASPAPTVFAPPIFCLAPPADTVRDLPNPIDQSEATGQANIADTCDRFVVEFGQVYGGDVGLWVDAQNPIPAGAVIADQASCNASRLSASSRGQLPGHFVWQNGTISWVEGAWQTIESFTEYGVWNASTLKCTFQGFKNEVNLSGSAIKVYNSPYTRLQLSTRGVLKTTTGDRAAWMRSRGIRHDD